MTPQMVPYLVAPLVVLILILRLRRMGTSRRLRLEYLWVMPALLIAGAGYLLWRMPPEGMEWAWMALSCAIGAVVGWYRAKTMQITVDPQTHALNQQGSPAALIFIIVLIAVRFGLRTLMNEQAEAWHLNALFISGLFMVFVVGMLVASRIEMTIRARALLAQARSARVG
jgi:NAD/NADP transhydrogenase beta subunit